jgi:hypothetical protein
MLRKADLSEKNWRAHLSERVAETEDETTSKVDLLGGREGRNESATDHDSATSSNGNLAAKSLSKEGYDKKADDTADVVGIVHETEAVAFRAIKVHFPARHLLGRVHHHTGMRREPATKK